MRIILVHMHRILLTCPPMLKQSKRYLDIFKQYNLQVDCPEVNQVMTEDELCDILPGYDGWIIGDDPATRRVFEAGVAGKLRAAVKWGVGVDNVDFKACKDLGIPVTNIPGVFGEEVSDVALGFLLCLNRKLHLIDQETKACGWLKPAGNTLTGKKVCLVGFGDIGRSTARKLLVFGLDVWVSDPGFKRVDGKITCIHNPELKIPETFNQVEITDIDSAITDSHYIIVTCALNQTTHHLINKEKIMKSRLGVRIINVARGPVVCESDVVELLESGHIDAVGFDVFESEPLPHDSKLRNYPQNIYGSHNGSNTIEAVDKTSLIACQKISKFLENK